MAKIKLDNVVKAYPGGVQAVDHVNLEIADGEFLVLVGPSGCGKSTVLRMIAGLEDVTSGTIRIGEQLVNDLPPKDRDIAMIFQNYALYPHMTVAKNLAFGLRMRKVPKEEITRLVAEAAKTLGLEPYLTRRPGALSGGQRQRVAMGRAIVRVPHAFLMDEPLSNLDAKLRVAMRASLAQLHEHLRVTTVYVTHDQVEAMTLGDRVCVLREGVVQQVDTPQDLFDHPANLFVGGFIGSPAMNLVTAELVSDRDGAAATFSGYRLPIPSERLQSSPQLESYFGREVILGIRPSDIEAADAVDDTWARMKVTTHVTEALGDEIQVIFPLDAPPVRHKDVSDLAPGEDEDAATVPLFEGKSLWTARVNPRTKVKAGDRIDLGVDTRNLHFFDPVTGITIASTKEAARTRAALNAAPTVAPTVPEQPTDVSATADADGTP
jgi:multiple sugar transport system ATP-binding protein